ncbi:MAG: hypothetical protein GDA36_07685 [Rhodobacteraceae bacterium]|nr:hypothetical protein [Paracoccaceae bacterium]
MFVIHIRSGTADNAIPETACLNGTVPMFDTTFQDMIEYRIGKIVAGQVASHAGLRWNCSIELNYA